MSMTPPKSIDYRIHLFADCFRNSKTKKNKKVYKGRVWRIEAIKVVLPTWERRFAFHPCSLDWSLSTRNWKFVTLLPLSLKFKPRYLLGFCTKFTLSCLARHSCSSLDMFREQKRSDFLKVNALTRKMTIPIQNSFQVC